AGLDGLEVGQNAAKSPAGVAHAFPGVVVFGLPAHIHHAVDRARAAEHAAVNHRNSAAVAAGTALGAIAPGQLRVDQGLDEARGKVDERVIVAATRFEQADRLARVHQAARQHASGGTGADDDIVEWRWDDFSAL